MFNKCLICHKDIDIKDGFIYGGGLATIDFGFGSKNDQLGHIKLLSNSLKNRLLCSDEIRFLICDDCFDKNLEYFQGYQVTSMVDETRLI
jgi:hypothetical protein